MDFRCVINGPFQENTWVVGDGAGAGMVVDPGFELDRVMEAAGEIGVEVRQIVCTHGHLDHASGVAEMKALTGAPFAIHEADVPMLERLPDQAALFMLDVPVVPTVERVLADGDDIEVGALTWRVVHTPGHTAGGCCLLAEGHAITGDSLFAGSIGRTDLPGGSWETYQETIRNVLLSWPDDLVIHPGHGPESTMAEERKNNPFLIDQM